MKSLFSSLLLSLMLLAAAGVPVAEAQTTDHSAHVATTADTSGTLVGVMKAQGRFGTLLKAVETAGMLDELMGEGPFTVFAPTDEAFAALDDDAVEELLSPAGRESLVTLLRYHVIKGQRFTASDLQSRASNLSYQLDTMGGGLAISSAEQGVLIGGATVASPNVKASNGIIHVMDAVIIPPALDDLLKNN